MKPFLSICDDYLVLHHIDDKKAYLLKSTRDPKKYVGIDGVKLVFNGSSQVWNYENEFKGNFQLKAIEEKLTLGNNTWSSDRESPEKIELESIGCGAKHPGYKLLRKDTSNNNFSLEQCLRQVGFSTINNKYIYNWHESSRY